MTLCRGLGNPIGAPGRGRGIQGLTIGIDNYGVVEENRNTARFIQNVTPNAMPMKSCVSMNIYASLRSMPSP